MSIERQIHQVWIGPKPVPQREARWMEEMRSMNPTWKHVIHGNATLERYSRDSYLRELLERKEPWAYVSDRLRALILNEHGGVYLDADCQPIKPLDTIGGVWDAPHVKFVAAMRNPMGEGIALSRGVSIVDNTFIASVPNGRMIKLLLRMWTPRSIRINGNLTGKSFMAETSSDCVWLNFRFIYGLQRYPESVVLHDGHNLGSYVEQDRAIRNRIPQTAQ